MKAASVKDIKVELESCEREELVSLCLRLSKFKQENKELLSYLLFYKEDEVSFIHDVKILMDELFAEINISSYYYIRKTTRKILRITKKFIRYSPEKTTEVELLIHFCKSMLKISPSIFENYSLAKLYARQFALLNKALKKLHEDLQYDYQEDLKLLDRGLKV